MPQTKKRVLELLDRLPDDCSMEDVLYHLYVLDNIDKGLAQADAGDLVSHETVAAEMRAKWLHGRGE